MYLRENFIITRGNSLGIPRPVKGTVQRDKFPFELKNTR